MWCSTEGVRQWRFALCLCAQIDRQAEDRCHRLGQLRPVTVYRFVTGGSVDQKIVAIANRKLSLDQAVLTQDGKGDEDEKRTMGDILKSLLEEGPGAGGASGEPLAAAGGGLVIPDVLAD